MHWLRRFRHDDHDPFTDPPLDIDLLVERNLHDRAAAQVAIDRLREERTLIDRQRRFVIRGFRQLSGGEVRAIARSGDPQLSAHMLSQAMNDAHSQSEALQRRDEQLAALDARQTAIRHAIEHLSRVR